MRPIPFIRPQSITALVFMAGVALFPLLPACAQAPAEPPAAGTPATQPATRSAGGSADGPAEVPAEIPPPPVPASRTRPEDVLDPVTRAGERLVREMVAAYQALPTLTDHVVMEFRIGIDLPAQEYRLRIDHGTNAWLETEVQEFTALGDTFYVLHRGVRDRYLKVPLVNNISETMGTNRSQFIPQFSLRYDRPMKQVLRSLLFLVPGEARISAFKKRVEGEDGRALHALTLLGLTGQSTVFVDAQTKLLVGADTEHTPANSPPGFKVKCHVSFDPQVSEELADPITFDPGRRAEVSTLAALLDRAPAELAIGPGDPVPEFVFFTLEGEKIALTDLRGSVVVMPLWASNCIGCRAELIEAGVLRAWAEESGLPVKVYPVNLLEPAQDHADKWESAVKFWDKERFRFPSLFDPDDYLAGVLGVEFEALPTTIIIDEQGRLVGYRRQLGENFVEVMRQEITKQLAPGDEPASGPGAQPVEGPPIPEGPPVPPAPPADAP